MSPYTGYGSWPFLSNRTHRRDTWTARSAFVWTCGCRGVFEDLCKPSQRDGVGVGLEVHSRSFAVGLSLSIINSERKFGAECGSKQKTTNLTSGRNQFTN